MSERVFLSEKTVVLKASLQGTSADEITASLSEMLNQPVVIKGLKGAPREEVSRIGHSVTSYGAMLLEDGSYGYILSILMRGTCVCGMFFYRQGTNYLTEMVDPDCKKVLQVVSGKHV